MYVYFPIHRAICGNPSCINGSLVSDRVECLLLIFLCLIPVTMSVVVIEDTLLHTCVALFVFLAGALTRTPAAPRFCPSDFGRPMGPICPARESQAQQSLRQWVVIPAMLTGDGLSRWVVFVAVLVGFVLSCECQRRLRVSSAAPPRGRRDLELPALTDGPVRLSEWRTHSVPVVRQRESRRSSPSSS